MGLKTTNYVSKSTGITLPTAYAKIKDLVLNDNMGRAVFAIQASREAVDAFKPIDKVEIYFTWDRKTDLAEMAYTAAKTQVKTIDKYDEEAHQMTTEEIPGILFGWEDDKVEE